MLPKYGPADKHIVSNVTQIGPSEVQYYVENASREEHSGRYFCMLPKGATHSDYDEMLGIRDVLIYCK